MALAKEWFIRGAGELIAVNDSADLPIVGGRRVEIYSLKREPGALIVHIIQLDGTKLQYRFNDIRGLAPLNKPFNSSELNYEENLTRIVDDVVKANDAFATIQLGAEPRALVVHLDTIQGLDKAMLANLLYHWNNRLSEGTTVVLLGTDISQRKATDAIRQLGNLRRQFIVSHEVPAGLAGLPEAHLIMQGSLSEALRIQYPSARWLTLERTDDAQQVGVFAFARIEPLLELVASGQIELALAMFKAITRHKNITMPEFELLLQGDRTMTDKYPVTFLEAVNFDLLRQIYQLSRHTLVSA